MKKLIIGAAVAAMGLGAFATDGSVSSANCVGYTSKAITAGTFYMVGVQFENVGADGVASFNSILSMTGVEAVTFNNKSSAPTISVREGDIYVNYYYLSDAWDADGNEVTGWSDGAGDLVTTADLALGDGFWFMTPTAAEGATITVAGQVTEANSVKIDFPGNSQFAIRANPLPAAVNLKNVEITGITAVKFNEKSSGAVINVREGDIYVNYYYLSDAWDADGNEVTGWSDGAGDLVDEDMIEAGASFWICSPTAGSITFSL